MALKRRLLVGGIDQNLDPFLGRLFDDRADAALLSLATSVDDLLETHWSEEIPNVASG